MHAVLPQDSGQHRPAAALTRRSARPSGLTLAGILEALAKGWCAPPAHEGDGSEAAKRQRRSLATLRQRAA